MGNGKNLIIASPNAALVADSGVPALLEQIRPAWKAKSLINRVQRLVAVDPSSACQRLLNAAIHDLKDKIVIAGIDIAREAAKQYKLPPLEGVEEIENYPTAKVIDLAYRMGLLSRPEWRRVSRCYEIRRDLEHEDDEYEAGVEDCVYIFKTCIEVILGRDPIHLLKVTDVKEIVEQSDPVTASETLVDDFAHAPQPRQTEIFKFLISIALDKDKSDIVQQNAFTILNALEAHVQNAVKLDVAQHLQTKIGRVKLERRHVRVAIASGALPYLRQNQLKDFYTDVLAQMKVVGTSWGAFNEHGELLRSFREVGGLRFCPEAIRKEILLWLVLTYIGTPGGRTSYGNIRNVFYSNTAAPIIREIIDESSSLIGDDIKALQKNKSVMALTSDKHIARRMESLIDIVDSDEDDSD
ncbi:MAG: hypothetical protein HYS17_06255 [Micavibrio aeruginosavorus]|uniref:Uncharacterized protein n=1 Tax=Micavibrio aeruginosavorus TaxID=349221 RepID=A0A7T5UIW2_9BACT|nr:MAG: hypothetical protein HYS17_06255 [Micavibrio aeruginosavorus]